MSRRQQWKHWQPGGIDPWQHNREVALRKNYRQLVADTAAALGALRAMQQAFIRFAGTAINHRVLIPIDDSRPTTQGDRS